MIAPNPKEICKRASAKANLLSFMDYCWLSPNKPLIIGKHTREICAKIDHAIEQYKKGISSYLHIVVPFRHGKSDMSSRYLPAKFLGEFPDREVMQVSWGADLSQTFSLDVKKVMESIEYSKVYDTRLNPKVNNMSERHIEKNTGKYFAVGADGGAAGKGADLLIVDDFFKNRAAAESETLRKKRWESFTQDFVSRCAPVHIVLVLNTRWHVDDISGNILKRNDKSNDAYVKDFPSFQNIHYKARQDDGTYLFPERFSEAWYKAEFASCGTYGAASLLQGEPTLRGGNIFKTEMIKIVEKEPPDLLWIRFWDLASSEKERLKTDPDWTAGGLVAYTEINGVEKYYVKDLKECQAEAPGRNKLIVEVAKADGPTVWQAIESVGGYKDAYTSLKAILLGKSIVHKGTASVSKIIRASEIEPPIEAGNFNFVKGAWNDKALTQMQSFPAGVHDDTVDAIVSGAIKAKERYKANKNLGAQLGQGAVD